MAAIAAAEQRGGVSVVEACFCGGGAQRRLSSLRGRYCGADIASGSTLLESRSEMRMMMKTRRTGGRRPDKSVKVLER